MKQNKILLIIIGIIIVIICLFFCVHNETIKTVSVPGECTTNIPRDKTAITLRVRTVDENSAKSVSTATNIAKKITDFVKTQPATAQTTDFSSFEKQEWNSETKTTKIVGIQTEIAIEISADKMETIESILSEFIGEKNVYSENLRMYASTNEIRNAMESCLTEAVKNAHNRAVAIADADNMRVGKMLSVSTGGTTAPMPVMHRNMPIMKAMATADSVNMSGTLSSSDTEVSVSVNATFELK